MSSVSVQDVIGLPAVITRSAVSNLRGLSVFECCVVYVCMSGNDWVCS